MSHYQAGPAPAHPGGQHAAVPAPPTAKRPGTLVAFLVVSLVSALSAVIGAVIVLAGGKELADDNIRDVIDENPDVVGLPSGTTAADIKDLSGPIWDELVSERAGSLAARAWIAVFMAVVLLVFALCARAAAAVWARVLVTICTVLSLFPHILIMGDYEPDSVVLLSLVSLLTALVVIVLCWLPPINRYARERKAPAQQPMQQQMPPMPMGR
ncbi:hypothetical protein [Streptomyces sp. NPDC002851]